MTLENLVNEINDLDDDMVIFQKDQLSIVSDVLLFEKDEGDLIRVKDGAKYVYFSEVNLAKEFIDDWIKSLPTKPNSKDIALRLLHYAVYDA